MATINYRDAAATMRAALAREEKVCDEGLAHHTLQRIDEAEKRVETLKRVLERVK